MTRTRYTSVLTAGMLLVIVAGCSTDPHAGYTTASQFPTNVRTIAVPIWQRGTDVYRRGLEDRLTEAVVKRIELDTPYKVTDKSRADTLLTGTIKQVRQRVISSNPDTGAAREMELTITVAFTWTDLRDGTVLVQKKKLSVTGNYITECGFSEDFFQGSEDVVNKLAKRIVEHMESPW